MSLRASSAVITILTMFLVIPASAEWLEFGAGCPDNSEPLTFHNITLDKLISFDVELQGLLADTVKHDGIKYLRFNRSPGIVPMDGTGYPEVPMVTCFVAVPDESDLELTYSASCRSSMGCLPVYPAPLDSLVEDSTCTPYIGEFFRKDSSAYASDEWYPSELAEITGEFMIRDQRVAIVNVYPVQYLASDDSLRTWSDIELSVNFEGLDPVWNEDGLGYYDRLIGDRLLGYTPDYEPIDSPSPQVFRHTDTSVEPTINPDYVIIVAPLLDGDWVDDFADYRSDLNLFDVLIVNADDIMTEWGGVEQWVTPDIIRDYMQALWAWSPPGDRPTYLLLIGDHEDGSPAAYPFLLPTIDAPGSGSTAPGYGNDEWYVYFDEPRDEYSSFPDMMVGRLPARDEYELQDMLDLIEDYESELEQAEPDYRRHLIRLAGTDHMYDDLTRDEWEPSVNWTDSFRNWMGYTWTNHYCGDGDDIAPNNDGSRMTSEEWVDACIEAFENGARVAFYTDHGDFHMFSAGLNWTGHPDSEPAPANFGTPDSTFDDLDVEALSPSSSEFWHPFVLMFCCSAGTFNHTASEHPDINLYDCLCQGIDANNVPYDFGTDCMAEDFIKNTDGGAIGVFASSNSSGINGFYYMGRGILNALFCKGITRVGDAIQSGRLASLDYFLSSPVGYAYTDLGRFNLLGDPAVDIGDRMQFRDCCDLIISPADLAINEYPTMSVDSEGEVVFRVTVRNAGWLDADGFDVTLIITDEKDNEETIIARCDGLDAGEETTLKFVWDPHIWFDPPGALILTASAADPGHSSPDSWMPNNSAAAQVYVTDFYPNDGNWPCQIPWSSMVPPILCDFDGDPDDDLEIIVTYRTQLQAYRYDAPEEPVWESDFYPFFYNVSGSEFRATIPVAGNVAGNGISEIIIDGQDELMVFDISSSEPIYSFEHSGEWFWYGDHTVALADLVSETDQEVRDEIVLVRGRELHVFDIADNALVPIRTDTFPGIPSNALGFCSWPMIEELNGSGRPEIAVRIYWEEPMSQIRTECFVYNYDNGGSFISNRDWLGKVWRTVPAVGSLPQGQCLVLPADKATSSQQPALVLDADASGLTTLATCEYNPNLNSYNLPYCIMADWEAAPAGRLDRIIAVAENQCFAWDEDGEPISGYPNTYTTAGSARPPFPALGNLDDYEVADILVATREGFVTAYDSDGDELHGLGFPYTLPSFIQGGFAIADIDNDGKVEVVFTTMDNYLHVWELGDCAEGYAPWPQCQHDAARTGTLLEE